MSITPFALTPEGCSQAKRWLELHQCSHMIDHLPSADGYDLIALANRLRIPGAARVEEITRGLRGVPKAPKVELVRN